MTCEQAGYTTMKEYRLRLEGYHNEQRNEWERARWQMFLVMQMHPHIKQGQKPNTPQQWIPFPWEKEEHKEIDPSACKLTDEQKEKLSKIFGKKIE